MIVRPIFGNYKFWLTSLITFLVAMPSTYAQDEAGAAAEEVVVVGIRKSLKDAMDLKQDADQIMDVISAEDIGKLPDNNIAEAMQRITGVQIGRDDTGAGSSFQVRGFSQNRVEINGRTLVGTNADDRVNAFDATPSELFSTVEIIKTPTADMTEGAIGATVKLKTFRPLDFKRTTVSGKLEKQQDTIADDLGSKLTGMFTTRWDVGNSGELGFLINATWEETFTTTENMLMTWDSYRGRQLDLFTNDPGNAIFKPRRVNIERKPFEIKQSGIDLALQWAPNEDIEFYFNSTITDRNRERQQRRTNLLLDSGAVRLQDGATFLNFSRPVRAGEFSDNAGTPATGTVNRDITLSGTHVMTNNAGNRNTAAPARFAANFEIIDTKQTAYAIGTNWDINPWLNVEIEFNTSVSESIRDNLNTAYNLATHTRSDGASTKSLPIIFDFTAGTDLPTMNYDYAEQGFTEAIMLDLESYTWNNFSGNIREDDNDVKAFEVDFDWAFEKGIFTTFETGIRLAERSAKRVRNNVYNGNIDTSDDPIDPNDPDADTEEEVDSELVLAGIMDGSNGNLQTIIDSLVGTQYQGVLDGFFGPIEPILTDHSGNFVRQFVAPKGSRNQWRQLQSLFTTGRGEYRPDEDFPFDITEETAAVYFKANFEGEWLVPFTGNFGVRYITTDIDADAFSTIPGQAGAELTIAASDYSNTLPSVNVNFLMRDDMFLRFGLSRAMTRPKPEDLSPAISINASFNGEIGNPDLRPLIADQFDVSWEYYINETTAVSAAVFFKDLTDFLIEERFGLFSGLDLNGFDADGNPSTVADPEDPEDFYSMKRDTNGGDGQAKGVELAYQATFDNLPGFWSGFGVQANYTFTDSDQDSGFSELDGATLPLPDLSEDSYNLILFYDKYGLEVRLAYNYRDISYNSNSFLRDDPELFTLDADSAIRTPNNLVYPPLQVGVPIWNDEIESLDFSISYRLENDITLYAQGTNITNDPKVQFVGDGTDNRTISQFRDTGSLYRAGLRFRFD